MLPQGSLRGRVHERPAFTALTQSVPQDHEGNRLQHIRRPSGDLVAGNFGGGSVSGDPNYRDL